MSIPPPTDHIKHDTPKGLSPVVAVCGAIVIALILVSSTYLVFNRSAKAEEAREISKLHLQQRKEEQKNADSSSLIEDGSVTPEVITKQTDNIDETLQSPDSGAGSSQADDLSDGNLGLN